MAAEQRPVLALDIGGTKLAVGVVTADGKVHGYGIQPTRSEEGPEAVIARLFAMGHAAVLDARLGPIDAVGISCGGPLDAETGIIEHPLHLPGWVDIPIVAQATAAFGVPAVLDNDATAAMLAEFRFGAAKGVQTAVYLTISTGVGGGSIMQGRLHRGAAGNGGEFGHIMVRPGGLACMCGRFGCLESYASGTSIAQRANAAVAGNPRSVLAQLETVRAEDVVAAVKTGDALATEIWDETTAVLGQAVTDFVNLFEPEVVVMGGGVTRAGDLLIDPVRSIVTRDAMGPAATAARLELAALGEVVCLIGAAAHAFDLLEGRTLV